MFVCLYGRDDLTVSARRLKRSGKLVNVVGWPMPMTCVDDSCNLKPVVCSLGFCFVFLNKNRVVAWVLVFFWLVGLVRLVLLFVFICYLRYLT